MAKNIYKYDIEEVQANQEQTVRTVEEFIIDMGFETSCGTHEDALTILASKGFSKVGIICMDFGENKTDVSIGSYKNEDKITQEVRNVFAGVKAGLARKGLLSIDYSGFIRDVDRDEKRKSRSNKVAGKNLNTIDPNQAVQFAESVFSSEGGNVAFNKKKTFIATQIPEKKLGNFSKPFVSELSTEVPLLLFDETLFGSAKEGFLLTNRAFYIRDLFEKKRIENQQISGFRHMFLGDDDIESKKIIIETNVGEIENSVSSTCGGDMKCYSVLIEILSTLLGV